MATEISFTNEYSQEITQQQLVELSIYHRVSKENSEVKTIELFKNSILLDIEYFLDSGEDEASIVLTLTPLVERFVIINDKSVLSTYTQVFTNQYSDGILTFKSKSLLDLMGNEICLVDLDLSGNPISTEKTLYDQNNKIELGFEYNTNGSIKCVFGPETPSDFVRKGNSVPASELTIEMPNLFVDHPYYQDDTFLPVIA